MARFNPNKVFQRGLSNYTRWRLGHLRRSQRAAWCRHNVGQLPVSADCGRFVSHQCPAPVSSPQFALCVAEQPLRPSRTGRLAHS